MSKTAAYWRERRRLSRPGSLGSDLGVAVVTTIAAYALLTPDQAWEQVVLSLLIGLLGGVIWHFVMWGIRFVFVAPQVMYFDALARVSAIEKKAESSLSSKQAEIAKLEDEKLQQARDHNVSLDKPIVTIAYAVPGTHQGQQPDYDEFVLTNHGPAVAFNIDIEIEELPDFFIGFDRQEMLELKPKESLRIRPRVLAFEDEDGVVVCVLSDITIFQKLRELSRVGPPFQREWTLVITYYDAHDREFQTDCFVDVDSDLGEISTRSLTPIGRLTRVPVAEPGGPSKRGRRNA